MTRPADIFRTLTHGVYVIGVADGKKHNAFTAAWAMQVSFDPLLLALSINPRHRSYPMLKAGGGFTVNVLATDQLDLAAHFGQSGNIDKLADIPWRPGKCGAPILEHALSWLDCDFHHECPAGDHIVVFGRVIGGAIQRLGDPLLYRDTGNLDAAQDLFPPSL